MRNVLTALVLAGSLDAWPASADVGPNGFDVSFSLVPVERILRGGPPKDGIPALTRPETIGARDAAFLGPDDLVIGVALGGEARAYPLRILVWHENANDVVGDVPVAVTYCPLCNSALVFDRRVGDRVLEFGVSGLLVDSNVLLYDRHAPLGRESLWSQVQMRAVTGPAAREGRQLRLLPSSLTTWARWREAHPETTVLSPGTGHSRPYDRSPYAAYFASDELMFPATARAPGVRGLRNKDPVVVVQAGGMAKAYPVRDLRAAAGPTGIVEDVVGGVSLYLRPLPGGVGAEVSTVDGQPVPVAHLYWFSLRSLLPEVPVFEPPMQGTSSGFE